MNARDIMTSPVISIAPDATVREIAALLLERRISALPVLDAGQLVGIVSEADLLHRHEIGTEAAHRPWWLSLVASDMALADYIKSHARRARDIMSARVVSVEDAAPVGLRRCTERVHANTLAITNAFGQGHRRVFSDPRQQ